jgi:hypothetical protein
MYNISSKHSSKTEATVLHDGVPVDKKLVLEVALAHVVKNSHFTKIFIFTWCLVHPQALHLDPPLRASAWTNDQDREDCRTD